MGKRTRDHQPAAMGFIVAWSAVALAAVVLVTASDDLPESVPVFQTILGTPTTWAPKSLPIVLRIASMGAGQLGAVTALARESYRAGSLGWSRLLEAMAVTAGLKTLVESIDFIGTGTPWHLTAGPVLNMVTILIVASFLLFAAVAWQRGRLNPVPRGGSPGTWVAIGLSLGLWLTFATIPLWY